jgi:hypothetical protein
MVANSRATGSPMSHPARQAATGGRRLVGGFRAADADRRGTHGGAQPEELADKPRTRMRYQFAVVSESLRRIGARGSGSASQ